MAGTYGEFTTKQDGIYAQFKEATAALRSGDLGLSRDGGTELQSALLMAWQFPDTFAAKVGKVSVDTGRIVGPVVGYTGKTPHTTVSDHGLIKGHVIDLSKEPDMVAAVDLLTEGAETGINQTPLAVLGGIAIEYGAPLTKGSNVIIPGRATPELWQVTHNIVTATAELGQQIKEPVLNHATAARFLVGHEAGSQVAEELGEYLEGAEVLGDVTPDRLVVAHFQTNPEAGFVLTPLNTIPVPQPVA